MPFDIDALLRKINDSRVYYALGTWFQFQGKIPDSKPFAITRNMLSSLAQRTDSSIAYQLLNQWDTLQNVLREKAQGNISQAQQAYLAAITRNHENAEARLIEVTHQSKIPGDEEFYRGILHERRGEWQDALACYENAIKKQRPLAEFYYSLLYEAKTNKKYQLGTRAFEKGKKLEASNDFRRAVKYYLRAAKQKHLEACSALNNLFQNIPAAMKQLTAEQMHDLAIIHHDVLNEQLKGLHWCKLAADSGYQPASLTLLEMATHNVEYAYNIAQDYKIDTLINQAAWPIAIHYFLLAAKGKHVEALTTLKNSMEYLSNQHMVDLADIQYEGMQEKEKALKWYQHALDHEHPDALAQMFVIAKKDSEFAYLVACKYEAEAAKQNASRETAINFFVAAAKRKHPLAQKWLKNKAHAGNPQAQYSLALIEEGEKAVECMLLALHQN